MDPASADSPLTLDPVFEWLYIDDDEADPNEEVVQVVVDVAAEDGRSVPWGTYAAPRHLPGKHDQSTHGHGHGKVGGMGEMARGTDQTEWAAELTRDGYAMGDMGPSTDFTDPRDNTLAAIGRRQGFDGKPTVGSIDETVKAGGIEIHRGVVGYKGSNTMKPQKAAEIVEEFKTGEYEPGTGLYGNGFYFSTSSRVARHYATWNKGDGARLRAGLKPGAKVVDYDHLQGEMKAWKAEVAPKTQSITDLYAKDFKTPRDQYSPHMVEYVMSDPGRFAAMKGYDAIKVVGHQDGAPALKGEPTATRPGGRHKFSANDQYVILNRTAIVIEEG